MLIIYKQIISGDASNLWTMIGASQHEFMLTSEPAQGNLLGRFQLKSQEHLSSAQAWLCVYIYIERDIQPQVQCVSWHLYQHTGQSLSELVIKPFGNFKHKLYGGWLYMRHADRSHCNSCDSFYWKINGLLVRALMATKDLLMYSRDMSREGSPASCLI